MSTWKSRYSLISIWSGAFSVVLACFSVYAESLLWDGSMIILSWLDRNGFTRNAPEAVTAFEPLSILSINDDRAITIVIFMAIVLAATAAISCLIAEKKQEDSIYSSAGYIFASLAIARIQIYAGMGVMIIGFLFVCFVRKKSQKQK